MIKKLPDFVFLKTEKDYQKYFEEKYCKKTILTFDKIPVKFYSDQFKHAFYESSNRKTRNKDVFSYNRAIRIDWIEYVLKNPLSELHLGWDRDKKEYNCERRVSIISPENYVVVIRINDNHTAKYITSYYADSNNTVKKIKNTPKWNVDI